MLRKSIFLLVLAGSGAGANAAEWKFDPNLSLRAGYIDNLRLTTVDEVSSAEATLTPSAAFSVATPTSGASGKLRFDFHRYEEDSDLDENNTLFRLGTYHNLERARLGLDLAYISDTTLDSQLEETGLALERVRRDRLSAAPSWTWLLSERTSLRASYNYNNVDYKNSAGTGFVDYTLNNASASLSRVLSERASASVTLSGTLTDNENNVRSTNGNLQAGFSYRFSDTLLSSAYAGVRHTQVEYSSTSLIPIYSGTTFIGFPLTQDVSNSDWGGTFSASLTKTFLRGESSFSASRDISNSVNGAPIEVNRANWDNTYRFSETFSGALGLAYYHSKSSNAIGQNLDRNYYQIKPEFIWKFQRFWDLTGSYLYRKQTFDTTSDDAVQNAAYLTLSYHWPRIAISR